MIKIIEPSVYLHSYRRSMFMKFIFKLLISTSLVFSQTFAFANRAYLLEYQTGYDTTLEYSEDNYGQVFETNVGVVATFCMFVLGAIIQRCESQKIIRAMRTEIREAVNQSTTQLSQQIDEYHSQCMQNYVPSANPYYIIRHGAAWRNEYLNTFSVFYIFKKEREAQQCINKIIN